MEAGRHASARSSGARMACDPITRLFSLLACGEGIRIVLELSCTGGHRLANVSSGREEK